MLTYIAGFYCSPEERAAYADNNLAILFAGALILLLAGILARKVRPGWLKALIVIAGMILAYLAVAIMRFMFIPWGC
jgi:small neutral amino acid transporter SnatA (MarC family)